MLAARALPALLALALTAGSPLSAAAQSVLAIAGGRVTGGYFAAAGAVQVAVNGAAGEAGPRLVVVPTDGSEENLAGLADGRFDLAIVAADWLVRRVEEDKPAEAPFGTVLVLGADVLTILTRADSPIADLDDLARGRIAAGPQGSPGRSFAGLLAKAMGWPASAPDLLDTPAGGEAAAVCAGEADAALLVVAHPSGTVAEAAAACALAALPLAEGPAAVLAALHPGLLPAVVPGATYPGIAEDVPSVGVGRVLIASSRLPEEAVAAIAEALLAAGEALGALHPTLSRLAPAAMAQPIAGVAVHPGAAAALGGAGALP
jgi:TRAP transporter TAXI family solute receptor